MVIDTISSIANEKNLASLVLNDQLDDLMPILPEEYHAHVTEFRDLIVKDYNSIIHSAMEFYEANKEKLQKEYALAAIEALGRGSYAFSVALSLKKGFFDEANLKKRYIANIHLSELQQKTPSSEHSDREG